MLRFSANLSVLFNEVPLLDRFEAAKKYGFEAVEIQFPYAEPACRIAEMLQRHQLQLVLFNIAADDLLQGGEGLASVPEKRRQFRNALAQAAEYAELLKPQAINVLPGRVLDKQRTREYLDTFGENLRLAIDCFAPLGVTTVFEAINTDDMPGFLIHNGRQMLDILKQVNHPSLAMQYDIYHMAKMGENISDFLSRHAAEIAHIQFADCPGRGQPGTGRLDFSAIFKQLQDSIYDGWVGAEYNPVGTTQQSLNWFKDFSERTENDAER